MFGLFKRIKKSGPTLEEQLAKLRELGFTYQPSEEGEVLKHLLVQYDRQQYEARPYSLLLSIIGSDFPDTKGNGEFRLSPEVWTVDLECIDDEGNYTQLILSFCRLAQGDLPLENIESRVDFERAEAAVSFSLNGESFTWSLVFQDDWADPGLFRRLGALALSRAGGKRYFYFNDGQAITFIYCEPHVCRELSTLTGMSFQDTAALRKICRNAYI